MATVCSGRSGGGVRRVGGTQVPVTLAGRRGLGGQLADLDLTKPDPFPQALIPMRFSPVSKLMVAATSMVSVLGGPLHAAERVERQMSLADCITTALEHNLDIQIERYNPILAEASLGVAYAAFDPNLTLRAVHNHNTSPGGRTPEGLEFPGTTSDSDTMNGSLSGLLPSGMNYTVSSGITDTYGRLYRQIGGIFLPVPFENTSMNLTAFNVSQPLLRNFWVDGTRLNVQLRKKDLKISDLNLRLRLINTVSSVEQAYYDLIAARENVKSASIALELARKLYEENRKRVEVGAMAQLDERQAQAQMAASEAAVIESRRTADFNNNILKNLLSDQYEEWHTVVIVPAERLEALPQDFDVQEAWNRAFQLRPDLLVRVIELEKQGLNTRFARNQLFPQLDIFGSMGWLGGGSDLEMKDAMEQVVDGDNPFHSYGAVMSIPLSNRRARENFRSSKDLQAQAELQLRQFRQGVMIGLHDAIQQAQASFERVRATREARQFAEEALAAEEKKLANGKSTSFEVLRLQRDLTQARFDETRALTDYNKALATVRQREGSTLLKFNLEAPQPPDSTSAAGR